MTQTAHEKEVTLRLERKFIEEKLRNARDNIREGRDTVTASTFREAMKEWLGVPHEAFDTAVGRNTYFKQGIFSRIEKLLNVPSYPGAAEPTPDQFAWAIQNFLNRRSDPWQNYRQAVARKNVEAFR
jgi:hypothetical protein